MKPEDYGKNAIKKSSKKMLDCMKAVCSKKRKEDLKTKAVVVNDDGSVEKYIPAPAAKRPEYVLKERVVIQ